ncbi:TetR/AcrR family transcriptional regulator [Streptomyces vinaceus]|uniref:TetR/AcrR family transcriptional regulator n=1 Tax=Streptomyces vinaceus TaxID=1960 RepID=A0A5J6J5X2_STRVI|nr:TetR/AcrR family transcriptional regulator [Streptomyces vinaceus]QEV45342.1 TetR/AcrR family transcriptional regulator [Streptomyces vinaceus]GHE30025.1 TetR family transcriptional regulator [Streptomyces vinaceus]
MGHREDLLDGAKKCLAEKGFARTTARDIVHASGANLASIGYHYGSKDALLSQAFLSMAEEWSDSFTPEVTGEGGSPERFRSVWDGMIGQRDQAAPMWVAGMEIAMNRDRLPELREMVVSSEGERRKGLTEMFTGIPEEQLDERDVRTLGGLYQVLVAGMMVQWLYDSENAVTAEELTEGMRRAAQMMVNGKDAGAEAEAEADASA